MEASGSLPAGQVPALGSGCASPRRVSPWRLRAPGPSCRGACGCLPACSAAWLVGSARVPSPRPSWAACWRVPCCSTTGHAKSEMPGASPPFRRGPPQAAGTCGRACLASPRWGARGDSSSWPCLSGRWWLDQVRSAQPRQAAGAAGPHLLPQLGGKAGLEGKTRPSPEPLGSCCLCRLLSGVALSPVSPRLARSD